MQTRANLNFGGT